MIKRRIYGFFFFTLVIGLNATQVVGANLTFPTGGRVTIELIFSEASFSNTLSVFSPTVGIGARGCQLESVTGLPGVHIGSEKLSQRGCRVELDGDSTTPGIQPFASGTTFEFGLCAQTDADSACEHVWSSNADLNPDNFDHLRTTPIRSSDFPGQIFQLSWEDLPSGGDMDFNDLIAVVRINVDSDGDGLWDDWERFGIDTDGDGTVDLDLPNLLPVDLNGDGDTMDPGERTSPNHRDIFLEVDYMECTIAGGDCAVGDNHSHEPKNDAIDAVIQAFDDAPVMNPDGTTGITLHVDVSNSIPHQNALNIPSLCFAGGAGIGDFDTVKADPANFGPNNPRRYVFHYALFTHQQVTTSTSSGCAELPGNDFQVSLGGFNVGRGDIDGDGLPDANVGTIQQQAGTLMHEFGHNLNLRHGGSTNVNRKPNYLSIMSYTYQLRGIPPTDPDGLGPLTATVDYSGDDLANLDEANLNEPAGIGDGTDNTRYFCPNRSVNTGLGLGAIDWNCDGDTVDPSVAGDINNDSVSSVLTGFDDWDNIRYDFQSTGDFDDGEHSFSEKVEEIDNLTNALILPGDIDGDSDVDSKDRDIFRTALGRCRGDTRFIEEVDYDEDDCITYGDYRIWFGFHNDFIN